MRPLEQAAGGIVVAPDGRIVVVGQQGRSWSLPKGHLEEGESAREGAEREITEESGLTDLRHERLLGSYVRSSISGDGTILPDRLKNIEMHLYSTAGGPLVPGDPDNPSAVWADPRTAARMLTHPADAAFLVAQTARIPAVPGGTSFAPTRPAHTAVILAAGMGGRLAPHTASLPKPCVPVAGVPLIVRTLDALTAAGIERSVIVAGYLADRLIETVRGWRPELDVRFVVNERYADSGTALSLREGFAALDPVEIPVIVEGDVVMEPAVLERLFSRPGSATAVEAFRPGLSGSFVTLDGRHRTVTISRADWTSPHTDPVGRYKTVNVHVVSHADLLATWRPALAELAERDPGAHLEHLIHQCLAAGAALDAVDMAGLRWFEVDDSADLAVAERLFADTPAVLPDGGR